MCCFGSVMYNFAWSTPVYSSRRASTDPQIPADMTGRTEYTVVTTAHKYSEYSEHMVISGIQVSESA